MRDQAKVIGRKKIRFELSEQLARYILDLLDVDDYEHSPNDYEAAKLRRNIEEQLIRASTPPAKREQVRPTVRPTPAANIQELSDQSRHHMAVQEVP